MLYNCVKNNKYIKMIDDAKLDLYSNNLLLNN